MLRGPGRPDERRSDLRLRRDHELQDRAFRRDTGVRIEQRRDLRQLSEALPHPVRVI